MAKIERGGDAIYAAFLTPQGRVLYDVFIHPKNKGFEFPHPTFLLDVDSRAIPALQAHLKKYLLRSKLTVQDASSRYRVWQVWGPSTSLLWTHFVPKETKALPLGGAVPKDRFCDVGCKDPRHPDLGLRVVMETDGKKASAEDYTLRRILNGIPEGVDDLFTGASLPLESNLDYMSGVDFRKGCYLGQELTIRTYHTGVTRKRIVPVQFYQDGESPPVSLTINRSSAPTLPASQSDIRTDSPSNSAASDDSTSSQTMKGHRRTAGAAGKFCSGIYNVGLALMRLEYVTSPKSDAHGAGGGLGANMQMVTENGMKVKAFAPEWWPHAVAVETETAS
ncbi:ccr4 associated factor [Rhizophlyctis rosea]|nr:ccr4 associated factor [Rhizophlyctis rosea]